MRQQLSTILENEDLETAQCSTEATQLLGTSAQPHKRAVSPEINGLYCIVFAIWLLCNGVYWGIMAALGSKVIEDFLILHIVLGVFLNVPCLAVCLVLNA